MRAVNITIEPVRLAESKDFKKLRLRKLRSRHNRSISAYRLRLPIPQTDSNLGTNKQKQGDIDKLSTSKVASKQRRESILSPQTSTKDFRSPLNSARGELQKSRIQSEDKKTTYQGYTLNGKRHGKGKQIFPDLSTYKGEWYLDKRHGRGTLNYPDGTYYEGDWLGGFKHGYGVETFLDGGIYLGEWAKSEKSGKGIMRMADGGFYEGDWEDDCKQGFGVFRYPNGVCYKGFWDAGKKHAEGKEISPDGRIVEGIWERGYKIFDRDLQKSCKDRLTVKMNPMSKLPRRWGKDSEFKEGVGARRMSELDTQHTFSTVFSERKTVLCSICGLPLRKHAPGSAYLDCLHWFHEDCLKERMELSGGEIDCPICGKKSEAIHLGYEKPDPVAQMKSRDLHITEKASSVSEIVEIVEEC